MFVKATIAIVHHAAYSATARTPVYTSHNPLNTTMYYDSNIKRVYFHSKSEATKSIVCATEWRQNRSNFVSTAMDEAHCIKKWPCLASNQALPLILKALESLGIRLSYACMNI